MMIFRTSPPCCDLLLVVCEFGFLCCKHEQRCAVCGLLELHIR